MSKWINGAVGVAIISIAALASAGGQGVVSASDWLPRAEHEQQLQSGRGSVSELDWFPGSSSVAEEEVIPPGFQGAWAPNKADCDDPYGVERMVVHPHGIDFYESGGRLDRVTQAGQDRSIKMKLSFEGEGGFWNVVWTATLMPDGKSVSIIQEGKESGATYIKCTTY